MKPLSSSMKLLRASTPGAERKRRGIRTLLRHGATGLPHFGGWNSPPTSAAIPDDSVGTCRRSYGQRPTVNWRMPVFFDRDLAFGNLARPLLVGLDTYRRCIFTRGRGSGIAGYPMTTRYLKDGTIDGVAKLGETHE